MTRLMAWMRDALSGRDARCRVGENLGDRLQRELPVMIALAVELAVDRC
jgi:hypothetical protein